jgi:Flp pilus assembly protein TadD
LKTPIQLTERMYLKLFVRVAGGLLLVVLLGWGGLHVFHRWQERHLVRRAAGYLAGGDAKTASLNVRRALQLNPDSLEAVRMMAQIAEKAGDGTELTWRRRVVELQPGSIDDALALVRSALRAGDLGSAQKALNDIAPLAQQTPAYHAALGRLAEMRNKPADAETHWAKALELAPADTAYQVQLAMLQLGSTDRAKRDAARETLERLRGDTERRAAATRALITDGGMRGEDPQRLRALSAELQSYAEATFNDRILYLEILRQLKDPGFADYLAGLQKQAVTKPTDLASLISWMSNHDAAEAVRFASTVPADVAAKWPVPLAVAEALTKAQDWAGLHAALGSSDWAAFEFLRRAYLARAFRGEQQQTAGDGEWARAQKAASQHPEALLMLARTVSQWGWQNETLELLWALSKAREIRMEALQLLYQHYAKSGDTGGVYRVLLRSAEIAPDDLTVQNNLAQVSLLLDADPERARKIAAELAKKEPTNAAYVSTYAFSLYSRGEIEAALQAMETLTPEQLQAPSIAAYYGVILAAAGQKEKAREYLQRGRQTFLLPEEQALIAKAETATH